MHQISNTPQEFNLTAGLEAAHQLLANMPPSLRKAHIYQQAAHTLQTIRQWVAGATSKINTLQEEFNCTHQRLDEVGVGHPEWDLPSRVVLMSFWMKNSSANARLLAALEVVEPHFKKLAHQLNERVAQHSYPAGYDLEQANWLNYVAGELATLTTWKSDPPDFSDPPLVRIRITGPACIIECPDWIKVEFIGGQET